MQKIFHQGVLLGIKESKPKAGTISLTAEAEPLQAMSLRHAKGKVVAPHKHKPVKRTVTQLQECLVLISGSIRIDLYGQGNKVLRKVTLKPGDLFLTVSGGHSVIFLKDSLVYEIKNGPFKPDRIDL